VCALLSGPAIAHAEDPPAPDGAALTPPRLTTFVEAEDPRPAGAAERASVELELDIDVTGKVRDARVVRSAGTELDEAALAAARSFVFEPARRGDEPVRARIRYEYVFAARAQPPSAPAEAPPAPAAIAGTVLDRETGEPIADADVLVTTDAGATYTAKTDARGAFRVDGVAPGPAHVVITAEDHMVSRLDETLEPGTLTEATLRLDRTPDPDAFVATARIEAPPREVTKRSLERTELAKIAGTRGDPIRAVELLPGVGRPPVGGGLPVLRGANPYDTQVSLEGAPVPLLFHLGGLTSFVHSRVVDTVDLYPSNFSVRYGRKVGGVIEVRLRDPKTDGLHGIADVSMLDSSLLVETPVGEKVSFLAAVRRSNIDAVLNSAQNTVDLAITAAPVYWDYQAIVAYQPTDADRLRLVSYGSSDRLAVVLANPADAEPAFRGALDTSSVFHRVQLGYRHRFGGGSEQNTEITYGRTFDRGRFGPLGRYDLTLDTLQGRSEWVGVVSPAVRIVGGVDLLADHYSGSFAGLSPRPDEGEEITALSAEKHATLEASQWVSMPGAYLEAGLRPMPSLLVSPGVRADYNDLLEEAAVDPRLSMRFDATERTAVKAGIGRFSQSPDVRHVVEPVGNPSLGMPHALHASAGVEQKVTDALSISAEAFAKWIDGVVARTPGGRPPFFENSQQGRVFGGELLVRVRPRGRFFGFLSYTLMRSERRDPGQAWRLFERDQPHIVNAVAVYRLGRGWEAGASVRYTSGTPYTPVIGSTYEATSDVYSPRLGRPMSARNPAFSRIDLRLQKTWTFGRWSLAAYLDVQNVLNAKNHEGFEYTYDYRARRGDPGLPILPIIGLRGEL